MPPKKAQDSTVALRGWKAIVGYLGIPTSTVQRWARDGMPAHREGRFTVADPKELSGWLGREAHMPAPAQVMTGEPDIAGALKASIAAAHQGHRKR